MHENRYLQELKNIVLFTTIAQKFCFTGSSLHLKKYKVLKEGENTGQAKYLGRQLFFQRKCFRK